MAFLLHNMPSLAKINTPPQSFGTRFYHNEKFHLGRTFSAKPIWTFYNQNYQRSIGSHGTNILPWNFAFSNVRLASTKKVDAPKAVGSKKSKQPKCQFVSLRDGKKCVELAVGGKQFCRLHSKAMSRRKSADQARTLRNDSELQPATGKEGKRSASSSKPISPRKRDSKSNSSKDDVASLLKQLVELIQKEKDPKEAATAVKQVIRARITRTQPPASESPPPPSATELVCKCGESFRSKARLTKHHTTCSVHQATFNTSAATPASTSPEVKTTTQRVALDKFKSKTKSEDKPPDSKPLQSDIKPVVVSKVPQLSKMAHESYKANQFLAQKKRIRLPKTPEKPQTMEIDKEDSTEDSFADLSYKVDEHALLRSNMEPMNRQAVEQEIATQLKVDVQQVRKTLNLLAKGCTLPFIVRYRQEETGGLNETAVGSIIKRFHEFGELDLRKRVILSKFQEELNQYVTSEDKDKLHAAQNLHDATEVLDIVQQRQEAAKRAFQKGLQPLIDKVMNLEFTKGSALEDEAKKYINPSAGLQDTSQVLEAVFEILAEKISENHEIRKLMRQVMWDNGILASTRKKEASAADLQKISQMYCNWRRPIKETQGHNTLALDRGEKLGVLKVDIELSPDVVNTLETRMFELVKNNFLIEKEHAHWKQAKNEVELDVDEGITAAWKQATVRARERLQSPIAHQLRRQLREVAHNSSAAIFGRNIVARLLRPGIKGQILLVLDPGMNDIKYAVMDDHGHVLDSGTSSVDQFFRNTRVSQFTQLVEKYNVKLIAIGNGLGSGPTKASVNNTITKLGMTVTFCDADEYGASQYSVSTLANEEFPDYTPAVRSCISIGRRLLDPLSELIKVPPRSLGLGLYQHDLEESKLRAAFDSAIRSCVNSVGINVNTAGAHLLSYVSGLTKEDAQTIVDYRKKQLFTSRAELRALLGEEKFLLCAGFLRVPNGTEPLDNTNIHPESYKATMQVLEKCKLTPKQLQDPTKKQELIKRLNSLPVSDTAKQLKIGEPTLRLIIENLKKPGMDPRDNLPRPILRAKPMSGIEDLQKGELVHATITNVVDYGAYLDLGVQGVKALLPFGRSRKRNELTIGANPNVPDPTEILNYLTTGDVIDVVISNIDIMQSNVSCELAPSSQPLENVLPGVFEPKNQ